MPPGPAPAYAAEVPLGRGNPPGTTVDDRAVRTQPATDYRASAPGGASTAAPGGAQPAGAGGVAESGGQPVAQNWRMDWHEVA